MSSEADTAVPPAPSRPYATPISPTDLVPSEGRLGSKRMRCPHPRCPWWVPESREHLADAHRCIGDYYDSIEHHRSDLVDTSDTESPEDYIALFIDDPGDVYDTDVRQRIFADVMRRPRSERVALLFGFEPFDYQQAIFDDPNPDVSVNTGRQVGKTEVGGAIGADAALFTAYIGGEDVAFFGDVQQTAEDMFERCKKHLRRCPLPVVEELVTGPNKTAWEFKPSPRTGGTARIYTGTLKNGGDTERGRLPRVIVVDESALVQRGAFEDVIKPMFTTHGERHELYEVSTPRGQSGYHFDANMPDRAPRYFTAHSVPVWANLSVDESYLHREQSNTDTDSWRAEYLGEFVEEGNAYIPPSLYRECIADLPTTQQSPTAVRVNGYPKAGVGYYGACDPSGEGDDRTVYMIATETGALVHIEHEEKSRTPDVEARILDLHEEFNTISFGVDKNSIGEGVFQNLRTEPALRGVLEGIPFSTPRKSAMYKTLKKDFEGGNLFLPKHGALERETTRARYSTTRNRHVQVHAPSGGRDDHPDCLALVNYLRSNAVRYERPQHDGIRSIQ